MFPNGDFRLQNGRSKYNEDKLLNNYVVHTPSPSYAKEILNTSQTVFPFYFYNRLHVSVPKGPS
jgi:hypothetical protein